MSSITTRLTVAFAVIVTATTALLLALGGWLLVHQLGDGIRLLHEAEFEEVEGRLAPDPGRLTTAELGERLRRHTEIDAALFFFQVCTPDGTVVFRSLNLGDTLLPPASANGDAHRVVNVAPHGRLLVSEFRAGPWRVQIASPLAMNERLLASFLKIGLLLLVLALVAGAGLGYAFTRFALSPVRTIEQTASRIRADNLGERIPVPRARDEIAALAELLNRMFDRLEVSFNQVRRFTADASHELKTPLALLRLNAERLRSRVADDSEAAAAADELLAQADHLHRIIEALLFLAKADAGVLNPAMQEGNPQTALAGLAEDAAALAEDRGLRFALVRNDAGCARFEPTLLRQLLMNLLTNALKVSPAGGTVRLESICADGRWRLRLTDEGPGLPPEQLDRVFERFVRHEPTAGGGHGLGLAICRSIVELHGGTIRAENRPDRSGLGVTVDLPLAAMKT
ncbi:MAG: HAMP domain-containing protein [Opitutaceae bacterium]|nr:HAMP domain-containing protein [Opitutaceae bacterium]